MNRQGLLRKLLDEGDYVAHNKLDVAFSQHDVHSRLQKHIKHNHEYAKKQEMVIKKKEAQEADQHKMKVFLQHRKHILQQIR